MCEPITLAAMSVAIAGAGIAAKDAQRRSGNKLKDQAATLQKRVFGNQLEGIANEFAGNQIAASEDKQQIKINALKARSTAQLHAGDTTGLSVDAVLNDFARQEGRATSSITQGLELRKGTTDLAVQSAALGTEGALFNLRKEKFNPGAAALELVSAGVSGFNAGGGFKPKVKQGTNTRITGRVID